MKNIIFLCFLLVITNCARSNVVYWCGDHPCINKKEKEAYFKKTMIVEVRELKGTKFENKSELEKITQQINLEEKDAAKKTVSMDSFQDPLTVVALKTCN